VGFWTAARAAAALLLLAGCAGRAPYAARSAPPTLPPRPHGAPPSALPLPRIEFSIQVGAFASPDNAIRLRESLEEHGVEAFHFVGDDGLCRVRFGSFSERALAVEAAEALRRGGVIQGYYVVPPGPSGLARGDTWLRGQIVRSAMSFLGWPYRWGGPSPESGFDCSGLTMTAYRLNGIALPRTSGEQFVAGASVSIAALRQGDLVFFAIESQNKPTHVGLYLGDGRFIHAPGAGKVVRIDDLSRDYFARRFLAARSYVDAE
jgi:hypothetical protein